MKVLSAVRRVQSALADRKIRRQVARIESWLAQSVEPGSDEAPVLFFNASTRLYHLSLNAAFSLLASWAVRRRGVTVGYVVCHQGMEQCILGTDRDDFAKPPPCRRCIAYSEGLFPEDRYIELRLDPQMTGRVSAELEGLDMEALAAWSHAGLPVGQLCLPGLRWALRRHDVPDVGPTRALFRHYLRSAASLVDRLDQLFEAVEPRALVVFNGLMYPEAVARQVARRRGIPVVSHEVGLRPHSAFFSHAHATFRDVDLPDGFALTEAQRQELDNYLESRRRGRFSMAGIEFWPEMRPLPGRLAVELNGFGPVVPVFTNVVFDTSQVHANTLYSNMFAWLEDVRAAIEAHPETLFVLRAHPDEDRPGKSSRQSVEDWVRRNDLEARPNVVFIAPSEYVSSYELIERAKFVLVYNSSIGLEASIMGRPVLCAGRARYTQVPAAMLPESQGAYRRMLEAWLAAVEVEAPPEQAEHARRFLYFELKHASLNFSEFLGPYPSMPGMVTFTDFEPKRLEESEALSVVVRGILEGEPFVVGLDEFGGPLVRRPAIEAGSRRAS